MDEGKATDEKSPAARGGVRRALVAGGGTGGHVFPALAVAEELAVRGWEVGFAGRPEGLEARIAGARGLGFYPLAARPFAGRRLGERMLALGALVGSSLAARRLVRRRNFQVVVGTGGYASAPAVLGGRWAGRPVVLVEPNARAGLANRWLSRFAAEAAVARSQAAAELRCPSTVTGVPVRREFFAVPLEPAAGPGPRLLVLGGSQGARQLNELLPAALERAAAALPGLAVRHQCGPLHTAAVREAYAGRELGAAQVEVVPFLEDVAGAMAEAHLVVSRAGAVTLAEICAAGRGAVLVPLALAGGHQVANAELLVEAGAAQILSPGAATAEALGTLLEKLLAAPERLREMGRAARRLARPEAAAAIAERVVAVGERR